MSSDGLSFRVQAPVRSPRSDQGPLIALLLVVLGGIALTRSLWEGQVPEGALVEVLGDVPRPGLHLVPLPATVHAALAAAGLDDPPADTRPVPPGRRVRFDGRFAFVEPPSDPLLVGLPIDIDTAEASAFEAIPGVGAKSAARIVSDRLARGSYRSIDDLGRVPGVTQAMVERIRPFAVARGRAAIDPNTAPAERLQLLQGIGPVLAERIVEHRRVRGPFADVDALSGVPGVSVALVDRLREQLVVDP